MISKVKTAVIRGTRTYHLAALFTLGFFAMGLNHHLSAGLLSRHLLYTLVFFCCAWAACRLFTDGLRRRLCLEGVNPQEAGDMVKAGEAISTVGSSGGQDTPALYFAIRQQGQPVVKQA